MALTQQPAHFNHLLASSPFQENGPSPSSPLSQSSEATRYFSGAGEYDEASLHSYSSPPSSVPSSGNTSFVHPFADFQEYCPDASFGYGSSPLNIQHVYNDLPQVPLPPANQMEMLESSALTYTGSSQDVASSPLQYPAPEGFYAVHDEAEQQPQQAERARMIPGLNMDRPDPDPSVYRPEVKRRKTCPDELMSSPIKRCRIMPEKRGAGKDGEDVWPTEVEVAFFEAVRLIPKLGRKKVCINGKPCGRNEMIGDYIRRKTGRIRSRKQVSSHIQVLKNIRKHDLEFMDLVAEPKPGEAVDDFTSNEKRALFFAPQEFAHITPENAPAEVPMPYSGYPGLLDPSHPQAWPSLHPYQNLTSDGLLSPYCGGSFNFAAQSSSSGPSSPALSAVSGSGRSVSPYPMSNVQTPSNEDLPLSNQVFQMNLAPPSPAFFVAMRPAGLDTPTIPTGAIKGEDTAATPKGRPSKLGHRRVASRGLALTIPPNTFGAQQQQQQPDNQDPFSIPTIEAPAGQEQQHQQVGTASNPATPWPQMLHTPTCPPPAPNMLPSPTQRHRLTAIWAQSSADWNKASPALESSFEHELAAAVASSKNMQDAASRSSVPLKRSNTDIPVFVAKEPKLEHVEKQEDPDNFFSSLLGSRDF